MLHLACIFHENQKIGSRDFPMTNATALCVNMIVKNATPPPVG